MILGTYANLRAIDEQQSVLDIQHEQKPEILKVLKKVAEPNVDPGVKSLVRPEELNVSLKKAEGQTKRESKINEESKIDEKIVDTKRLPSNDEQNQSDEFFEDVVYTEY